ncbi:MAG: ferritin [bacterium]|nr:ferritin [bacterium]
MLSKKMEERLNEQVRNEWISEYYYLAMMAWCFNNDYDGFGMWFLKQADEERAHGMKLLRYLNEAGGSIRIPAVAPPGTELQGVDHMFELTWEHERKVTAMIHEIADLARQEKDYATDNFLQWFIKEQVEEENTVRNIVAQLRRIQGAPAGLFMLESKLAARQ